MRERGERGWFQAFSHVWIEACLPFHPKGNNYPQRLAPTHRGFDLKFDESVPICVVQTAKSSLC